MMSERRSAERLAIEAKISCSMHDRSLDAIAYDLSTDGCMIEVSNASPNAGDRIVLCFPGQLSIEGKVVWAKYRNAGVQFREQMDRRVVRRIVRLHARPHCARGRPGGHPRGELSPTVDDTTAMNLFANSGAKLAGWQRYQCHVALEHLFLLAVTVYGGVLLLA